MALNKLLCKSVLYLKKVTFKSLRKKNSNKMYGYYGLGYGCGLAYGGYTSYLGGYGSRYCW